MPLCTHRRATRAQTEKTIRAIRAIFSAAGAGRSLTFTFPVLNSFMGITSLPGRPAVNMDFYYCNPFFRRCKQNFRQTGKFFDRKQRKPPKCLDFKPKPPKNRPEPPSGGALPGKPSGQKPPAAAQADVPAAQGEVVVEPDPEDTQQEEPVGEHRVLRAQRPQKAVK